MRRLLPLHAVIATMFLASLGCSPEDDLSDDPEVSAEALTSSAFTVLQGSKTVTSFAFAPAAVGGSVRADFTVKRSSTAHTSVTPRFTVTGDKAAFVVQTSSCAKKLAPGKTCPIVITFAPTTAGAKAAVLTVSDSGNAPFTLKLSGTTTPPFIIHRGDGASIASYTFVPTAVGSSAAAIMHLTRALNSRAAQPQFSFTGIDAAMFSVRNSTCGTLNPGTSCSFDLFFSPTSAGTKKGTLVVGDGSGATVSLALSGSTDPFIIHRGDGVKITSYTFTPTAVNSSAAAVMHIDRPAAGVTAAMPILSFTGPDAAMFSVHDNMCTAPLAPGQSCGLNIFFTPSRKGSATAAFVVSDVTGNAVSLNLSGSTDPFIIHRGDGVQISSYTFIPTGVNQSAAAIMHLTRPATAIFTQLPVLSFTGPDAAMFTVQNNTCTAPLAPGQSCTLDLFFTPTRTGTFTASFVATDAQGASTSLALVGPTDTFIIHRGDGVQISSYTFVPTVVGTSAAALMHITRPAGAVVPAQPLFSFTGPAAAMFSVHDDTCTAPLNPGQECTISLFFTPASRARRPPPSWCATPSAPRPASPSSGRRPDRSYAEWIFLFPRNDVMT